MVIVIEWLSSGYRVVTVSGTRSAAIFSVSLDVASLRSGYFKYGLVRPRLRIRSDVDCTVLYILKRTLCPYKLLSKAT